MALDNNGNNAGRRPSSGQGAANGGQRRPAQSQSQSQSQRFSQTQGTRSAQPQRTAQTQRSAQQRTSQIQSARTAQTQRTGQTARTGQTQRAAQSARTAQSQRTAQTGRTAQRSAQQRAAAGTQQTASQSQRLTQAQGSRPAQAQRAAQTQTQRTAQPQAARAAQQPAQTQRAIQPQRAIRQQPAQQQAALTEKELKRAQKEQAKAEKAAAKEQKKPKGKKGWRIVFIISLIVFLVGLVSVGTIMYSYWHGQRAYNEVAEAFETTDTASPTLKDLKVDWAALKEKNPDTVAWIYIPGTEVNYPVVKGEDNSHYLKTDFNGETNWVVSPGAIFMDFRNDGSCTEDLTVMYGHNMNDGSMFSQIAAFDTKNQFNDNRDVYLLTPAGNLRLTSFALKHGGADDAQIGPSLSAEEKDKLIRTAMGQSVVKPDGTLPDSTEIDNIYVLSTCDNLAINGRYLLYCYVAESTLDGVSAISGGHRAEDAAAQAVTEGSEQVTNDAEKDEKAEEAE